MATVSMKDVLLKSVLTSDAYDIGTVNDFYLSVDEWKVDQIGVTLNMQSKKDLGIRKLSLTGTTICIPISYVNKVGDMVTLNIPFDELKGLPECKNLQ
ncbi:MAG: PRC-barrel domain-containing protein [Methanomassiliicoccales archaeon]|nr:PRC-barrel domain-containing protein [Methanomassiliicoccales archaeon]